MLQRSSLVLLLVVFVQMLGPSRLDAQSVLSGAVRDANDRGLPGVSVHTTSPALAAPRTTVTNGSGLYSFIDLPSGTYAITFTLPGFRQVTRNSIVLPDAGAEPLDVVMHVALEDMHIIGPRVPSPGGILTQPPPTAVCTMRVIPANPAIDPKMSMAPDTSKRYTIVQIPPPCVPSHPEQGR